MSKFKPYDYIESINSPDSDQGQILGMTEEEYYIQWYEVKVTHSPFGWLKKIYVDRVYQLDVKKERDKTLKDLLK